MRVKFTSIFPPHCHKSGTARGPSSTFSVSLDAKKLGLFGTRGEIWLTWKWFWWWLMRELNKTTWNCEQPWFLSSKLVHTALDLTIQKSDLQLVLNNRKEKRSFQISDSTECRVIPVNLMWERWRSRQQDRLWLLYRHVNCALNAWNTQKSANHIGLLDLYEESWIGYRQNDHL